MTDEAPAIRVKAITDLLGGADPVEFMYDLIEKGYERFYVKVPDGFRCDFREPRNLFAHRIREEPAPVEPQIRHAPWPSYVQLSRQDVDRLLESSPITLQTFNEGALFRLAGRDGRLTRELDYARIRSGELQPETRAALDATPLLRDAPLERFTVAKGYQKNSNIPYFVLRGVDFSQIYVEGGVLPKAVSPDPLHASSGDLTQTDEMPEDPFHIQDSSPVLFQIFRCAFDNRLKKKEEVRARALAAHFDTLNAAYEKNPTPFGDKRAIFAAHLARPGYNYPDPEIDGKKLKASVSVPDISFFNQSFISSRLAKVLYAACRWSGAMTPDLGRDSEKLVQLLVDLGLADRDEADQVQSSVFFITGEMYQRNKRNSYFRHTRGESRRSKVR